MNSGESLQEYQYKKKPFIVLWKKWEESEKNTEVYQSFSKYVWPYCVSSYIEMANMQIRDKALRNYLITQNYSYLEKNTIEFCSVLNKLGI